VLNALAGQRVREVAVAPVGDALRWPPNRGTGKSASVLLGACQAEPQWEHAWATVRWYRSTRSWKLSEGTKAMLTMARQHRSRIGILRAMYRGTRARVCCMLAGPIAEGLAAGDDVFDMLKSVEGEVHEARGYAVLLPRPDEFVHAFIMTNNTLCLPHIWEHVIRLAEEVKRLGTVKNPDAFLPPKATYWPPSPITSLKRVRRKS